MTVKRLSAETGHRLRTEDGWDLEASFMGKNLLLVGSSHGMCRGPGLGGRVHSSLSDEPHKEASQCGGTGVSQPLPRYLGPLKFEGLGPGPSPTSSHPRPTAGERRGGQRLSCSGRSQSSRGRHTASCRSFSKASRARSGWGPQPGHGLLGEPAATAAGPHGTCQVSEWGLPGSPPPAPSHLSTVLPASTEHLIFVFLSVGYHGKPQRPLPPPSPGSTPSQCLNFLHAWDHHKHSSCLPQNAVTSKFILFPHQSVVLFQPRAGTCASSCLCCSPLLPSTWSLLQIGGHEKSWVGAFPIGLPDDCLACPPGSGSGHQDASAEAVQAEAGAGRGE